MNDKQQLAAMGEYLAEQQPLCMAKRIEELEALLREARDMMDNQPRGFSGMIRRIDALLAGQVLDHPEKPLAMALEPIYYMRDNHTFKRLSDDVDTAIKEIEAELDDGWSSGMLCSNRGGFSSLHANSQRPREEFLSDCRDALLAAALEGKLPDPVVPEGWQLVPVEPTREMRHVLAAGACRVLTSDEAVDRYYLAMLAAAPKQDSAK